MEPDSIPIIPILVNGIRTLVLVDSGASVNIIGSDFLVSHIDFNRCKVQPCKLLVRGISGQTISVDSFVDLEVKIQKFVVCTRFFIAEGVLSNRYQAILSYQFLSQNKLSMNFKDRTLRGSEFVVSWGIQSPTLVDEDELRAFETEVVDSSPVIFGFSTCRLKLRPHSEQIVSVRAKKGFQRVPDLVLIEPANDHAGVRAWIARSVNSFAESGVYNVKLANTSSSFIHLNKGTKLVSIEPLVQSRIDVQSCNTGFSEELGDDFEAWGGNLDLSHLNDLQRGKLLPLLEKYKNLFAHSVRDLVGCDTVLHRVQLADDQPVRQKFYRVPYHLKNELNRQVNELLEVGIVKESNSPYSAPVLLVKKKDGSFRLCTDFRKLNLKSIPDSFPIPNITELVDNLGNATLFSTMDLCSGFFQMKIDPKDTHKAAFVTEQGLYEWTRMPFGMRNAPNSFQRLMEIVLSGLKPLQIAVYLDDIIVASTGSIEEHLEKLCLVFERLQKHGLRLKPSKCCFLKEKIDYLGFTIHNGKVFPDEKNIETVKNFKVPGSRKQVRAFLGLTGFYRRFIPNYADLALPLTNLTKGDVRFIWKSDSQEAFEKLKSCLVSAPCLRLPDFSREFTLSTDASKFALGAVLCQNDEQGFPHPVAYASKKLKDAEIRYSTVEKEMLGVVFGVTHFGQYLYGKRFIIYCDQASLSHALNVRDPTSRIARWVMTLQQYDYIIKHKPGKLNITADYLSRAVNTVEIITTPGIELDENFRQRIKLHQSSDPRCQQIVAKIGKKEVPFPKHLLFFVKNELLYCSRKLGCGHRTDIKDKLVVPLTLVPEILRMCHDSPVVAHQGFQKTLNRVRSVFYWGNIYKHVLNYVKSCDSCVKRRGHRSGGLAPLQRVPVTTYPMECVAVDAVGPLPLTCSGNKYILVMSDYFTRWPEAYPVPDIKSETVARILEEFICRHGVPARLITDRGTNFLSHSVSQVYQKLGIEKHTTTAYHPQSDGVVERLNGTLIDSLSHLVDSTQVDWDRHVPFALLAHRSARHSTTKESPAFLIYGRDLRLPYSLFSDSGQPTYVDFREYAEDLLLRLQRSFSVVKDNLISAAERQEKVRDRISVCKKVNVGDLVHLFVPVVRPGVSRKLSKPNVGPFRVSRRVSPVNFEIVSIHSPGNKQVVHVDRLTKVEERLVFPTLDVKVDVDFPVDGPDVVAPSKEITCDVQAPCSYNRYYKRRIFHNADRVDLGSRSQPLNPGIRGGHSYNLRPRNPVNYSI